MIQVQFANYVSRRLASACKLCNQPADTQYQVCRSCMKMQAEKLAAMWERSYPCKPNH